MRFSRRRANGFASCRWRINLRTSDGSPGQLRRGVVPLFKPDEARNENFIEATRNQLRKAFELSIGKTEYTLTENEMVKILTLPTEASFYYITLDKDTKTEDVHKIIGALRELVKEDEI